VVEAGVKDGGGVAGVFGCAKDGDGVGGLRVVLASDSGYLLIDPDAPCSGYEKDQREQPAEKETAGGASASQVGGRDDHRRERTKLYGERMRAHIGVKSLPQVPLCVELVYRVEGGTLDKVMAGLGW
jgi:hypothetical protein